MKLLEIYNFLLESKASEVQGLNILKKSNIDNSDEIIRQFASGVEVIQSGVKVILSDESVNQKNIPFMAFIYANGFTEINTILTDFNAFNKLLLKKRVKPMQMVNNQIVVGDKKFNNYLTLSEFIHGETNKHGEKSSNTNSEEFTSEVEKLWSGNNIDIYDGGDVGKCIQYTQGGLTGKNYPFCIGQFGNSMYQSYRDTNNSSFYFIVDKNKFKTSSDGSVNLDDPLHIVVFDATANGISLTDANNTTGNISEFGEDVDGYINYLKGMGVPVDKMINRPKTDAEDEEQKLLGRRNSDLNWFKQLSYEYKSKYIGRGHPLTDDQFIYLNT